MIVVTGAAGFIGSNIVAALNAAGRSDIVAVDAFDPSRYSVHLPNAPSLLDAMDLAERVEKAELSRFVKDDPGRIDAIIHMGACSDTTRTDRDFMMANNYHYTQSLWTWCTAARKPFIYASSAATYGDGSAGYDDRTPLDRYEPLNIYGQSKHEFDRWALKQSRTPPRWAGLKFFNVYGPREHHKGRMASVAYHAYNQIRDTGQVRLFMSHKQGVPHGGQRRDFIYVADAVAIVLHFLNTPAGPECPNGIYNAGTGLARSFADLARAVFTALDVPANIEYFPMPEDLQGRYQYYTQAETAKLRSAGFTAPFHSIEDGVAEYVAFLQANPAEPA